MRGELDSPAVEDKLYLNMNARYGRGLFRESTGDWQSYSKIGNRDRETRGIVCFRVDKLHLIRFFRSFPVALLFSYICLKSHLVIIESSGECETVRDNAGETI